MKNVFLLTVDCLGADKLWCEGTNRISTLATLEEQGVSFRNAFSTTSSTTPSIASILTGLYPSQHGILSTRGWSLAPQANTLAERMKSMGYFTAAYVSGPLTPDTRLNVGFDDYVYVEPLYILKFLKWGVHHSRYRANSKLLYRVLNRLHGTDKPWFQWVHLLDLHNRWRRKTRRSLHLSGYEQAVIDLDAKLEQVFEFIDLDNTIVVVCADHGHFVRELDGQNHPQISYQEAHGFHVYDLLTRIPLIILNRGVTPAGGKIVETVQTVDIAPTILSMLGGTRPDNLAGQDLRPFWEGKTSESERLVYLRACGSILGGQSNYLHAVRSNSWKLVCPLEDPATGEPELYCLREDPFEQVNVANKNGDVVFELMKRLNEFADYS